MRCKDAALAPECSKRWPHIAREHGIQTFDAYVMPDNQRMMRVFRDSGFEVERRLEGGTFHVALSLARHRTSTWRRPLNGHD